MGQPTGNRRANDPLGRDKMKQIEHVSLFVRPEMIPDQKRGLFRRPPFPFASRISHVLLFEFSVILHAVS